MSGPWPGFYHTRPLNDVWDFGISVTAPVRFGAEFERPNNRSITVNLSYGQASDGRVETDALPLLGPITSQYDSRQFMVLDLRYKWR